MKKALHRFLDVWKLDFLAKFFAGEYRDTRTTVVFWILSNIVVSFIFAVQIFVGMCMVKGELINSVKENVADGASVTFQDGQMVVTGMDDPFFREMIATQEKGASTSSVFIIDQHANTYDLGALDEYGGGLIMLHDRAYVKDGSDITQILYADMPNFSVSKEQVIAYMQKYYIFPFAVLITILGGIFIFLFMLCVRTVGALWWAAMLYVIGLIMNVHMAFGVAYKSVLNLYLIPMLVTTLLMFVNVQIPLLTTVIFIAIFVANLLWFKKHRVEEETIESEQIAPVTSVSVEEGINRSAEK